MAAPYAHPEVLVSTEWVAEHLWDISIVVVEVNTDLDEDYTTGHVRGAVGWSLHDDLEDRVKRDIPGLAQFEALMRRSGISRDTTVVLYGDGNNRSATWAFWVMKIYRHPDARIMDGGRAKWQSEGRELSTETPVSRPTTYRAGTPDRSLRAMKDYVAANLGKPGFKPLDTRTLEEFTGELTSAPGTPQPDIYRKGAHSKRGPRPVGRRGGGWALPARRRAPANVRIPRALTQGRGCPVLPARCAGVVFLVRAQVPPRLSARPQL